MPGLIKGDRFLCVRFKKEKTAYETSDVSYAAQKFHIYFLVLCTISSPEAVTSSPVSKGWRFLATQASAMLLL